MLVDFQASKILINCGIVDHVISNPVAHDVGESGALGNDRGTHPPEDDDANIRGLLSTTLLRLLHSPPPKKKKKKKIPMITDCQGRGGILQDLKKVQVRSSAVRSTARTYHPKLL